MGRSSSPPPKLRANPEGVASTFEARGVAIGFTTPGLSLCRVRRDYRGQLEIVLPNIAGGNGVYVVPWRGLHNFFSLTVHDRALQAKLSGAVVTPEIVRQAELVVAASGLAGPDIARACAQALDNERRVTLAIDFALMLKVIALAAGLPRSTLHELTISTSEVLIERALRRVAMKLGVPPTVLEARIQAVAEAIAAIGLPGQGQAGRLLRLLESLEAFGVSVASWGRRVTGSDRELADFCRDVTQHTIAPSRAVVRDLHSRLDALPNVLAAWPGDLPVLREYEIRLAWLLDGWSRLITAWNALEGCSVRIRSAGLADIAAALPLLPKSETDAIGEDGRRAIPNGLTRQATRQLEDWRTGKMIGDLIKRIEMMKAKAMVL